MFIEYIKAVFYGIIEGITEWLPISSTGHLILLEEFISLDICASDAALRDAYLEMFDVIIQIGAVAAVLIMCRKKLIPFRSDGKSVFRLWSKIIVACIPAALAGTLLDGLLEKLTGGDLDFWLYNAYTVAAMLIFYGIIFIAVEKSKRKRTVFTVCDTESISYKKAFRIGLFQALALVPGTSRSGSTVLGGMFTGLSRPAATQFSFFMALPVMAGAGTVKICKFFAFLGQSSVHVPISAWVCLAVAFFTAFAVSAVCIKFLTDFVKKHTFVGFGIYRIVLGIAVLIYFWVK